MKILNTPSKLQQLGQDIVEVEKSILSNAKITQQLCQQEKQKQPDSDCLNYNIFMRKIVVGGFFNSSNIQTFLFSIIFCLLIAETNCIYANPVSGVGPFYTEQLTIVNTLPYTQSLNYIFNYNGWTFTSGANPISNEYVALSIISLDVISDNGYLTFGISNQTVYQSNINLTINFCEITPSCFRTVTYRMLAIDYDFLQGGTTSYDQVKNGIFVATINVIGVSSFNFTYTPLHNTTGVSWSVNYLPYIRGFRLQGPSNFEVSSGGLSYYTQTPVLFQFSISFSQVLSGCQAEIQMVLINLSTLTSKGNFKIPVGVYINGLSNSNQIIYSGSSNNQYLTGENLILGMTKFTLSSISQLALNTTVTTTRNFQTDSATIFGSSSSSNSLSMQFVTIQKVICFSPTIYYLSDLNMCSDACPYLIQNAVICNSCSILPSCLTCNGTVCLSCDTNTRYLTTNGQCLPLDGYYENNQVVASPCCGNCSICVNSTGCDTCISGSYFYSWAANQCLECQDIFVNCSSCLSQNPGVICQACDTGYYIQNSQCILCVPNCTSCVNGSSCSSCLSSSYVYVSSNNQCLLCSDLFSNCQSCSISPTLTVSCLHCSPSYYFNSTKNNCLNCVPNCTTCTNGNSCDLCIAVDYFYLSSMHKCLLCEEIISNCLTCAISSSKVICSVCNTSYFFNSTLPGCQSCVQNCINCSNATSCNTCQSVDYYYWSRSNKCLICQDIFSNCLGCSNSTGNYICLQCNDSYFFDSIGLACTPCVQNCTGCVNNKSCNQCVNSDYFYWIPDNKCLLCPEIYMKCVNCSENTTVQYGVQCVACEADHILIVNSTYQKCSKQCGDSAIQGNQSCDDGNLINQDGCNNLCEVQQNFTCLQVKNKMYPDFNTSHCIYTSPIEILQTYLQKMPNQNKVELRFNFYPKLTVFETIIFDQTIEKSIEILWNGYINQTLTAYKIPNGLQQNGLFGVSFQYNQQWDKVQAIFIPQNTGLCVFTQNCNSTRFLLQLGREQTQQQIKIIKDVKNMRQKRLLTSSIISTPQTIITLPQKSSNNLEMFSDSYFLYSITQYTTYFLIGIVWIYWLIGLFYGKIVVLDFMITVQLILLCSMTVGLLNPGFSGMMSDNFVFLCFTDLFKPSYESRPIYQNINLEFKSANISYHAMTNLNLMVFLVIIVVIIGIIVKILEKVKKEELQKRQIFQTIFKYCFGQFLFYVIMPFSLNGSLSSILYIKTFIKGGVQIQFSDILSLLVFNALIVFVFVLFILSSKNLGQFRSQFLRFDISQQFYLFMMICTIILGYVFGALSGTSFLKYFNAVPVIIFVCMIVFVICKNPYLQKRHMIRIILNNMFGIILIGLILFQNIIEINTLKSYLAAIIVIAQILLAIFTGYFLYKSVRVEGCSKFYSFLSLLEEKKQEAYQSVSITGDQKEKFINKIGKTTIDYYQKQSKLLKNIKTNNLPPIMSLNYEKIYQNLKDDQLNEEGEIINQANKVQNHQENKCNIINLLKNSKLMKMSLRQHLVDQNSSQPEEKEIKKLKEELQKYVVKMPIKQSQSPQIGSLQKYQEKPPTQQNQNFSEDLISNYKFTQIFSKKIQKRKSFLSFSRTKINQKQKAPSQSQQNKYIDSNQIQKEIQQIKGISYGQWARKIEQEQQLQKIKEEALNKQKKQLQKFNLKMIIKKQQSEYNYEQSFSSFS